MNHDACTSVKCLLAKDDAIVRLKVRFIDVGLDFLEYDPTGGPVIAIDCCARSAATSKSGYWRVRI